MADLPLYGAKLCATCKHFRHGAYEDPQFALCAQPLLRAVSDPVLGTMPKAAKMRAADGPCGIDALKHEIEEAGHA